MDLELERLITSIHGAGSSSVVVTTGGGASAGSSLLAVPGASRTILEVLTPYSETSFIQFLGKRPEGFCTLETGVAMAEAAWARALILGGRNRCLGVACTASLASDRPKRGEHRFFAALASEDSIKTASVLFAKGARSRAEEEAVVSRAILNLIAEAVGIEARLSLLLRPGEVLECPTVDRGQPLSAFLRRDLARICSELDGRLCVDAPQPLILMPGSFNPLHEAHLELLRLASEQFQSPGAFELSVTNVDKPPLGLVEIRRRLQQFHGRAAVWLTHAPTFVEKSRLFPGCRFVIGVDTAARLVQAQYYELSAGGIEGAAGKLRSAGCSFLVAARAGADGKLVGLEDLTIPDCFAGLLEGIPKSRFHNAISSTELRKSKLPPP